jgi:hypothetical protein
VKKLLDRRILSLALAIVMAFSLAGTAFAVGSPLPVETPLWFTDPEFINEENNPLGTLGNLNGHNTIQKVLWSNDDNLYIIIHPQYFGGADSDDDAYATAMAAIVDIWVYDPIGTDYAPCATGNLLTIPQSYIRYNQSNKAYLQFAVDLTFINFCENTVKPLTWVPAYLDLSLFPPEPCQVIPSAPAAELEDPVGFNYDTPIWFEDIDFQVEEYRDVFDSNVIDGENTVQKVFHNTVDDTYYMIIHPEYFGSINHDEPEGATAMVTIVDLLVATDTGNYVPCLTGNLIIVPESYVKINHYGDEYLDFIVTLRYFNFCADTNTTVNWKPAYLNLGVYDPPPCGA